MDELTYAEVGATRNGPLPAGYRHLSYRTRLGRGGFDVAADAVLTFAMHRATGERVTTSAPRAAPGVAVTSRIWLGPVRLTAPCRVVWAEEGPDRAGFAYGTLPGHPARGEESFVVTQEGDEVWFTVTAFSVPARWYMAVVGPVAPLIQAYYARLRARGLRRLYHAGLGRAG
jgi:uncharacterized protein (UPF0548 family)